MPIGGLGQGGVFDGVAQSNATFSLAHIRAGEDWESGIEGNVFVHLSQLFTRWRSGHPGSGRQPRRMCRRLSPSDLSDRDKRRRLTMTNQSRRHLRPMTTPRLSRGLLPRSRR